jgi:hypothetical protein
MTQPRRCFRHNIYHSSYLQASAASRVQFSKEISLNVRYHTNRVNHLQNKTVPGFGIFTVIYITISHINVSNCSTNICVMNTDQRELRKSDKTNIHWKQIYFTTILQPSTNVITIFKYFTFIFFLSTKKKPGGEIAYLYKILLSVLLIIIIYFSIRISF